MIVQNEQQNTRFIQNRAEDLIPNFRIPLNVPYPTSAQNFLMQED